MATRVSAGCGETSRVSGESREIQTCSIFWDSFCLQQVSETSPQRESASHVLVSRVTATDQSRQSRRRLLGESASHFLVSRVARVAATDQSRRRLRQWDRPLHWDCFTMQKHVSEICGKKRQDFYSIYGVQPWLDHAVPITERVTAWNTTHFVACGTTLRGLMLGFPLAALSKMSVGVKGGMSLVPVSPDLVARRAEDGCISWRELRVLPWRSERAVPKSSEIGAMECLESTEKENKQKS